MVAPTQLSSSSSSPSLPWAYWFSLSPPLCFFLCSLQGSTFVWDTVSLSRSGTLNLNCKLPILGSTRALTKQKMLTSLLASCWCCMPWWMMLRGQRSAAGWRREKEFVYSHRYICWVLCDCAVYSTMTSVWHGWGAPPYAHAVTKLSGLVLSGTIKLGKDLLKSMQWLQCWQSGKKGNPHSKDIN